MFRPIEHALEIPSVLSYKSTTEDESSMSPVATEVLQTLVFDIQSTGLDFEQPLAAASLSIQTDKVESPKISNTFSTILPIIVNIGCAETETIST